MEHRKKPLAPPREKGGVVEAGLNPAPSAEKHPPQPPGEVGGPKGPEPTRYGDWEVNGRCSDF